MEQRIIEGTWEEVARLAPELAGHRVRVTVLDEVAASSERCVTEGSGSAAVVDPVVGLFRDSPELLDAIVEEAMGDRAGRPWRLPAGE